MAKVKPIQTERKADEWSVVWDAYDLYRELRMNMKYYGWKLTLLQRWNMAVEIVLAISASTTVIAILKSAPGHALVPTLALISALLSVTKPILGLPRRIERYSKLWVGYATAFAMLGKTIRDIQVYQCVSEVDDRAIRDAQEQSAKLCIEDDVNPSIKRMKAFRMEVAAELPMDRFWQPPSSEASASATIALVGPTVRPA